MRLPRHLSQFRRVWRAPRSSWSALMAVGRARRTVRGKLVGMVLLTTTIALLAAGTAMLTHDLSVYRTSWASDLATEASILALSTAPALAFDDHEAAERNLAALQARRSVLVAALYANDGSLYARYVRPGAALPPLRAPPASSGVRMAGERAEFTQPIIANGETLGTIFLRARYDVIGRVKAYSSIFALVTLMSLGVALVLCTALQKFITRPLEVMADVARQVVHRRDYSLRARKTSDDEIGLVVEAFNSMLDEVQARARASEQSNAALMAEVESRQMAEQALRDADRRKDEFLATLAHELRNPLAPIRHAVRLLEVSGPDEQQRQWGRDVIARQVQRMALLLDDLLDVSRITRGRLVLRKDYVNLATLVGAAVETARPMIEAKKHVLRVELPPQALELEVDPLRLSQALSNLLTNAAKYTDSGGNIVLSASLEPEELVMSVKDSGIGIDPQALPKLFEMFSQIDSAIDRAEGGLGIGLSLVKGLIALHGGKVEAVSAGLGQGSEFRLHLPRSIVVPRREESSADDVVTRATIHSRCKVLVADDNRDAAETLAMVLRVSGHQVSVAHCGAEALQVAQRERHAAFVLDIGMPDLTGHELARRLRQEAWGRHALLVALTGWGQDEDRERSRAAGFDHHLTKPVDAAKVEELLRSYLETKPTRQPG